MNAQENHSEIARLRQRIAEEYEAAMRGLTGLAYKAFARWRIILGTHQHTVGHLSSRIWRAASSPGIHIHKFRDVFAEIRAEMQYISMGNIFDLYSSCCIFHAD